MPLHTPSPHDTIAHSRQWLSENRGKGVTCPSCLRKVKEYERPINRAQALALVAMYVNSTTDWTDVRSLRTRIRSGVADKNNEISKLAHWGLVQQHPYVRKGGWWRVTNLGAQWVRGEISVPSTIFLYQAELTGHGTSTVMLQDVLEKGSDSDFDLRAIMADISGATRKSVPPSDPMFSEETLLRRARRKVNQNGVLLSNVESDDDGLLADITAGVERIDNALNHEFLFDTDTIGVARSWLKAHMDRGGFCPSCDRITVFKHYPMKDSMARLLIEMYRHHGTEAVHVRTFELDGEVVDRNNYVAKIAQRKLVEELPVRRGDGGKAGWYRVTDAGVEWIMNRSLTPATTKSYNYYAESGQSKKLISVVDAMRGGRWSYSELIRGIAAPNDENELLSL